MTCQISIPVNLLSFTLKKKTNLVSLSADKQHTRILSNHYVDLKYIKSLIKRSTVFHTVAPILPQLI